VKNSKIETFFENAHQIIDAVGQTLDEYNKTLEERKKILDEQSKRLEYNIKKYEDLVKALIGLKLYLKNDLEDLIQPQLLKIAKWKEASFFIENFSHSDKYQAIEMIEKFIKSLYHMALVNEKEV